MQIVKINIIGGGLAGCECAYQLLKRGYNVTMYEMKGKKFSPAHHMETLAELVCSNSLKSTDFASASGVLKRELNAFDCLLLNIANETKVPAGNALAVDRELFSKLVTDKLCSYNNFTLIREEVTQLPHDGITVIATGPLTSEALNEAISKIVDNNLYFFDAIAPIVDANTIDYDIAYIKDRYDKGDGDYINLPFTKVEYEVFYNELIDAQIVDLHDFEKHKVYEGCMPIEVLAKRGEDAMRFGPMKPVGLTDPHTGKTPYAVVQLRKESNSTSMYNIVGFQTNLTYPEQKRVFRLIPGLKNAEFYRFGTMHKNTYICSPKILNEFFQVKDNPNIFFAGQISGVEGYVESIASGLMVGINISRILSNLPLISYGNNTMLGALSRHISTDVTDFQPMSSNMGLINTDVPRIKDKKQRYEYISDRSYQEIMEIIKKMEEV